MEECYSQVRATSEPYGSDELTTLQLYIAWRSNGLLIETPAVGAERRPELGETPPHPPNASRWPPLPFPRGERPSASTVQPSPLREKVAREARRMRGPQEQC